MLLGLKMCSMKPCIISPLLLSIVNHPRNLLFTGWLSTAWDLQRYSVDFGSRRVKSEEGQWELCGLTMGESKWKNCWGSFSHVANSHLVRKLSWPDGLHYFYISEIWIYVSNEINQNIVDSPTLKICNIWLGRALSSLVYLWNLNQMTVSCPFQPKLLSNSVNFRRPIFANNWLCSAEQYYLHSYVFEELGLEQTVGPQGEILSSLWKFITWITFPR